MAMVRTSFAVAALAIAATSPLTCVADPVAAPAPPIVPPVPQQITITNLGATSIIRLSISPSQGVPSGINRSYQPLYPGVSQPIAIPAAAQCCYDIKAVYSDGHTVTVPFWNITNIPAITIRP